MELSPDAILLGLDLTRYGRIPARRMAALLRELAAAGVPDQVVALEESILSEFPDRAEVVARLAGEARYVPVDCPQCRARFRVPPRTALRDAHCPLCGEPLETGRRYLFRQAYGAGELIAAEAETLFRVGGVFRRFAHFEIVRLLGKGGAGRVYEARNLRTGRSVALKLLDFRPLETVAGAVEKLRREARIAGAIEHPNLVPVYDMGVAEGTPFLEMELVGGDSLGEKVRLEGALAPETACELCIQVLRALAAVHAHGIVHGDVKPSNILVDAGGRARLTDFGLSRLLEETTTLSAERKVVGSPYFMAPEQWRGEALEPRTDLYAAGLVLYYALTGVLPFEGSSSVGLMYKHLHEPVLHARDVPMLLPDYLGQVVRRAAEKAPERRFGSAVEMAEALRAFLEGSVFQQ